MNHPDVLRELLELERGQNAAAKDAAALALVLGRRQKDTIAELSQRVLDAEKALSIMTRERNNLRAEVQGLRLRIDDTEAARDLAQNAADALRAELEADGCGLEEPASAPLESYPVPDPQGGGLLCFEVGDRVQAEFEDGGKGQPMTVISRDEWKQHTSRDWDDDGEQVPAKDDNGTVGTYYGRDLVCLNDAREGQERSEAPEGGEDGESAAGESGSVETGEG